MNSINLTMAKEALDMFVYLAAELTILFLAISYLVGVLQEFISPEKVQSMLSSRNGKGYIIAALLGSITPFCSCSTIPFLKGLLRAKAGFGPMMVFLFASPLLNPIVIGLFIATFGLQVAVLYFLIAISVSVSAGFVLEKLGFERYVRPEAYQAVNSTPCRSTSSCATQSAPVKADSACCATQSAPVRAESACCATQPATVEAEISCCSPDGTATIAVTEVKDNRWVKIWQATWDDFKQVLPYLLVSISIGALIYGFVPTELIVNYAGADKWYAIPVAAVIGIPLYIRAAAVIPLSAALVQKGMALGSVMALIIGSAGASLTEVILLRSIFKTPMIIAFLSVVLGMAIAAGFLYSFIFG